MSDPYLDLEPQICELAHIAAIARFYVSETSGPNTGSKEDRDLEDDRVVTAISHVAALAEDLRKAYYAKLKENA
jgi:hypothetical protein